VHVHDTRLRATLGLRKNRRKRNVAEQLFDGITVALANVHTLACDVIPTLSDSLDEDRLKNVTAPACQRSIGKIMARAEL